MSDIDSKRMSNINTNLSVRNIDINHSMLDIKTCIFPSPPKIDVLFHLYIYKILDIFGFGR